VGLDFTGTSWGVLAKRGRRRRAYKKGGENGISFSAGKFTRARGKRSNETWGGRIKWFGNP